MDARVGVDQPAIIRREEIAAFRYADKTCEGAPGLGKHRGDAIEEPVNLSLAGEKDAAQDQPAAAFGVGLGIKQRQRRPPRAAKHHPARNA